MSFIGHLLCCSAEVRRQLREKNNKLKRLTLFFMSRGICTQVTYLRAGYITSKRITFQLANHSL